MSSDESTPWLIKASASWVDKQLNIALESVGMSQGLFAIMMSLLEEDGLTQVEIGEKISMPGYATSRNIDELEKRNLVERRPHESSRRSYCIHITPQGEKLAQPLFEIALNIRKELHKVFDEEEAKTLNLLLTKLVRSFT